MRGTRRARPDPAARGVALVALLGIGAFAIDVGYAYYAKRQLQSATDAAALAGAQDLPTRRPRSRRPRLVCRRQHAREPPHLHFTYQAKCTTPRSSRRAATRP